MMFTCSALRCSVFDGSGISGTSAHAGADDPPAPQGIPDTVLYVTVDDPTFADVIGDLEHPLHLALDAARDVGLRWTAELDLRQVGRGRGLEEPRTLVRLGVRGEEAVDVGDEERLLGSERAHDIAERDRGEGHR